MEASVLELEFIELLGIPDGTRNRNARTLSFASFLTSCFYHHNVSNILKIFYLKQSLFCAFVSKYF